MQTPVTDTGKLRICLRQPAGQSSMEAEPKHCRQGESKNQPGVSLPSTFLPRQHGSFSCEYSDKAEYGKDWRKGHNLCQTSSRKSIFNLMVITCLNLEVFVNLVKTKTFPDIFSQINRILHDHSIFSLQASSREQGTTGVKHLLYNVCEKSLWFSSNVLTQ